MRIDSTSAQPQRLNDLLSQQQTKEVAGEKEPDGDSDDMIRKTAMTSKTSQTSQTSQTPASNQINPQGVGAKVDFFA